MKIQRIYVCTSKYSKLYRVFLQQSGTDEKMKIFNHFKNDMEKKVLGEVEIQSLRKDALIEDISYYVDFNQIIEGSYLFEFKEIVETLINNPPKQIIKYKKKWVSDREIANLEDNESIRFLIVQEESSFYFLESPRNALIKNRPIMSLSISENTSIFNVPKGLQIPALLTARLNRENNRLYVYDVNGFERMITVNENFQVKTEAVLEKFNSGDYKISEDNYCFTGLSDPLVKKAILESGRSIRRLAKYSLQENSYNINQVIQAVDKLSPELRVEFNRTNKTINVTPETAKTFVGICHNVIVQRLISGEIEIAV